MTNALLHWLEEELMLSSMKKQRHLVTVEEATVGADYKRGIFERAALKEIFERNVDCQICKGPVNFEFPSCDSNTVPYGLSSSQSRRTQQLVGNNSLGLPLLHLVGVHIHLHLVHTHAAVHARGFWYWY